MQAAASKWSPCCLGTELKKTNGGDGCKCLPPWCRTEISPSYLVKKVKGCLFVCQTKPQRLSKR